MQVGRQVYRHAFMQANRQSQKQAGNRHKIMQAITDKHAHIQACMHSGRHTSIQAYTQTDIQAVIEAGSYAVKQTCSHAGKQA